jgi:hypothetical protein
MKTIEEIRKHLKYGQFEFSFHAFKRSVERNISENEIREIAKNVEIIEDYPDDKYVAKLPSIGIHKVRATLFISSLRE